VSDDDVGTEPVALAVSGRDLVLDHGIAICRRTTNPAESKEGFCTALLFGYETTSPAGAMA
jgi:hypothetical protein